MEESTDTRSFWKMMTDITDLLNDEAFRDVNLEGEDITLHQIRVLKTVCGLTEEKPEGIPLKELAEKLNLSAATVSGLVETLVRKDSLERTTNPADRRAVCIRLSEKSILRIRAAEHYKTQRIQGVLDHFPQEQQKQLLTLMKRFYKQLQINTES